MEGVPHQRVQPGGAQDEAHHGGRLNPMSARMGTEVGIIWPIISPVTSYSNAVPRYFEFSSYLRGGDSSHLGSVFKDMSSRVSAWCSI